MNPKILQVILDLFNAFFSKKDAPAAIAPTQQPAPVEPPKPVVAELDWNDLQSRINKYFSVKEALFLPSWGVAHVPSEDEKKAILEIAAGVEMAADVIAAALGKPVHVSVHAWMRPEKANCPGSQWDGQDYNRYIYETQVWKDLTPAQKAEKKVPLSPHRTGHAIDFHIIGFEGVEGCAKIRQILLPKLEELGLRMEDIVGGWVHLDNLPVIHLRFFKP